MFSFFLMVYLHASANIKGKLFDSHKGGAIYGSGYILSFRFLQQCKITLLSFTSAGDEGHEDVEEEKDICHVNAVVWKNRTGPKNTTYYTNIGGTRTHSAASRQLKLTETYVLFNVLADTSWNFHQVILIKPEGDGQAPSLDNKGIAK